MKKRHLSMGISLLLILMVTAAFGFADTARVSADSVSKAAGFTGANVSGSVLKPQRLRADSDREYMEHAALVMFRTSKKLTGQETKKMIGGATDISVEPLWEDRTPADTAVTPQGRKMLRAAGSGDTYSSVMLVRSKKLSTEQLIKKMRARDDVRYAEPNYRIHALATNDPYFTSQWSMQGGEAGYISETAPNVAAAWKETTGSERIVAVVDSGVDYTNPDLKENMWVNTHYPLLKGEFGYDFIKGDEDPMDENGHGTHCAGIIGAQGNNGIGISGVNQKIRIMALRILDAEGNSYLSHEIAAYNYINKAIDLGEPVTAVNNSWGGGDYSQIFEELVNAIGEKGALTICAAGNDGMDNDEGADYPASIESPYLISVAATKENGELVSFSNYGRRTVDVAAPGTDILSTVSYDCYNPGIYGDKQGAVSQEFNDYETDPANAWGGSGFLKENLYLNGDIYEPGEDKPQVEIAAAQPGFLNEQGQSMEIVADNMLENDMICLAIPYEIGTDAESAPSYSVTAQAGGIGVESGIFGILDVPQGTALDIDALGEMALDGGLYMNKDYPDYWQHISFQTLDSDELKDAIRQVKKAEEDGEALEINPLKREIVLILYAYRNGRFQVRLDDMGLSRTDLSGTDSFGKYDFQSGTSMAAPYISGAVALKADALEKNLVATDPETMINEVTSMAKEGDLPIVEKGAFDFTKRPAQLGPRIGRVTVNKKKNTITITGSGFAPTTGLKVEIGPDEETMREAEILSQSDNYVTVKNRNWINNIEDIVVTGYEDRTSVKKDVYLVKGKKSYKKTSAWDDLTTEAMATDGRYIYNLDTGSKGIRRLDTKKMKSGAEILGIISPGKIFKDQRNQNARYAMKLGSDLVYMNGRLYFIVEYGEADEIEEDEGEWFLNKTGSALDEDSGDGDEEVSGSSMSIYSGEVRLICMSAKTGKVKDLGALPDGLTKTLDWTMAAYNGKLYFIGGYSNSARKIVKTVRVFDPAKKSKKWSKGPALPEGRGGGKALQCGNKLIYTMGYDKSAQDDDASLLEYKCPSNLIFNGKKWKVSKVKPSRQLEPLVIDGTVARGGVKHASYTGYIGLTKTGLIYMGMPVANRGDTIFYNLKKDAYSDSGVNFISDIDSLEIRGIAVGSKAYGFDSTSVYTTPVKSGLIKVKAYKKGKGKVYGTGSFMPGNNAKIKVRAAKGYVIKSIKVGKKKIKVTKNVTKRTFKIKRLVKNQKVKVVFVKK